MFIRNEKRFNIHASQEIDGVLYANFTSPEVRERLGITEIPDPIPPADFSEDIYYTTEQDDAPYVVYTKKSDEQILQVMLAKYEAALDNHLDSAAIAERWNNRFTFVARAGYPNPWQQQAIAFGTWMDACNVQAYELMQKVSNGEIAIPSIQEFLDSLPPYNAPSV